ncbi:MAG: DUF1175 family protein [Holophagaceae bacterium]|uniref:DUF1175 family protein n=1 Tax=Candidatus Geothrix skivensis TaxID=2954439 RepID=A0A9D7SGC9_9BACT|nr:DUF1175 family protein [Candidatus Geothrix skivensis]
MAFVRSDVDGAPVTIYHTGPKGGGNFRQPGGVRRVRLDDLLPTLNPTSVPAREPAFLGLYRWRLLAGEASDASARS